MTAEELFREYAASTLSGVESRLMSLRMFKAALIEHDKEIISKIENTIEAIKPKITNEISSDQYYEWTACIAILTELLTFIKEGI